MSAQSYKVEYCTKGGEPHGTRTLTVPTATSKEDMNARFRARISALIGIDSEYIVILQYSREV